MKRYRLIVACVIVTCVPSLSIWLISQKEIHPQVGKFSDVKFGIWYYSHIEVMEDQVKEDWSTTEDIMSCLGIASRVTNEGGTERWVRLAAKKAVFANIRLEDLEEDLNDIPEEIREKFIAEFKKSQKETEQKKP